MWREFQRHSKQLLCFSSDRPEARQRNRTSSPPVVRLSSTCSPLQVLYTRRAEASRTRPHHVGVPVHVLERQRGEDDAGQPQRRVRHDAACVGARGALRERHRCAVKRKPAFIRRSASAGGCASFRGSWLKQPAGCSA